MISETHSAFLRVGFRAKVNADETSFVKDFMTSLGLFKVRVILNGSDLTAMPHAYVIQRPDSLPVNTLRHLTNDGYLCYINQDERTWDPTDKLGLVALINLRIQKTLDVIIDPNVSIDIHEEFSNYWLGDSPLYVLSEDKACKVYSLNTPAPDATDKKSLQLVIAKDSEQVGKWARKRGAIVLSTKPINIIILKFEKPILPLNSKWPPQDLSSFVGWLKETSSGAYSAFLTSLTSQLKGGGRKFICYMKTDGGNIALSFNYRSTINNTAKNLRKVSKLSLIAPSLLSSNVIKSFDRLQVFLCTDDFLLSRNRSDHIQLSNKTILLIGAGSIGGYASSQLMDIGAGTGAKGKLYIFDNDMYKPENVARHILPPYYIGWTKSKALKHWMDQVSMSNIRVYAKGHFETSDISMNDIDLIVNATGHEPISIILSKFIRDNKNVSRLTPLVHGWIDGYGHAIRGLLDTGKACYCCAKDQYPVFQKYSRPEDPFSRICGKTFTPYDSGTALMSAAMIQKLALTAFSSNKKENTFLHIPLNATVENTRSRVLKHNKRCKVCNDE